MSEYYAATFSAVAVTAAQDIFELVAPSDESVTIKEVRIGQYSDAGDAQAEMLSVLFIRGYTTTGSGGSAVTPAPWHQGSDAANSTVYKNNTTVASAGTAVTLLADAFNVQAGFYYHADAGTFGEDPAQIILKPSERFVVRITAPIDSITMNATLVFKEGR